MNTQAALSLVSSGEAATRQLVRIASLTIAVVGCSIALLLLLDGQSPVMQVVLNLGAGLTGGLALLLAHRGHWKWSSRVLIWGVWCVVTLVTASNGGVRGPNLLNYPVLIVFSGWIMGERTTIRLTVATGILFLLLVVGDYLGVMPEAHYGNRWAYVAYFAGVLGLTAAATLLSRRSYILRMREAQDIASSLSASEADLRKLLRAVEQSPESIVITDLQERVEYVNEAFLRRSGYALEQVIGRPSTEVSNTGMTTAQRLGLRAALDRGDTWSGEQTNHRKDGSELIESVTVAPIRQPDGRISHFVELKQDISERKRAAAEIHRLAHFDGLTGLPNRSALMERLTALQAQAARNPAMLHAVLLLNLDRFAAFNDVRGNEMGDRLLCAVALRLSEVMPAQGLLVRVGGDEFAVVLHNLGTDAGPVGTQVLALAAHLQTALLQPMRLDGATEEAQFTASIGITLYPQVGGDSAHEALRRASTALHRARQSGGGHCAFFEQGMGEAAEQRFLIERELRHAIGAGELRLFLQTQRDVHGNVVGAEALVRWQHPVRGLVAPGVFIPVAEESDLIVGLGNWVLRQACELLTQPAFVQRRMRLSVNLSPRQFKQADFMAHLRQVLDDTGADPHLLTLEVTEGLVIDDFDDAVAKMRALALWGVEFSLDDFGTGYSSLAYLKRLPIHELKIDRSFVHDAPTDPADGALVEGILAVSRHFGLRVVAEGVETPAQADYFSARAPEIVYQGFLYGKPQASAQWMAQWSDHPAGPQ